MKVGLDEQHFSKNKNLFINLFTNLIFCIDLKIICIFSNYNTIRRFRMRIYTCLYIGVCVNSNFLNLKIQFGNCRDFNEVTILQADFTGLH